MASNNFIGIVRRERGECEYAGEQFGGATGATGRGLPLGDTKHFAFATGIECSYPTIVTGDGKTVRRDQLAECDHYNRFREDIALVRELGLRRLRYGLPYHLTHLAPGKYDWSFADEALAEIRRHDIKPILDLLHFGVPDWLGDFQNPELPLRFSEYAGAVAERYPWIRFYTPVNEIYVAAKFSGHEGKWNERLKTGEGFVTALKHLVAASTLAAQSIAKHTPNAVFTQAESAEYTHHISSEPASEVELWNKLCYVSLDLLYGKQPDADVLIYLLDNGLTREEYDWFMTGEPPGYQILGNDYYGRNEHLLLPDGKTRIEAGNILGWYDITRRYFARYRKPVFHTETNTFQKDENPLWLLKQWANVMRLRRDGVPVLGFTWYSLVDQVDWDTQLLEQNNRQNECGLYDLNRRPHPVAATYRQLLEEFGQITTLAGGEMFELTDDPARLKIEV